jgi:flagellar basal-body rod modification protein FlgD
VMVTSVSQGNSAESQVETKSRKNVLGKDDFLKLLVLQLRTQNPLDPMKDQDFGAQLAQFSALEAAQNMEKTLTHLLLLQAGSLVGQTVELRDGKTGTVDRVILGGDTLVVEVGGVEYQFNDVVKVG